MAYVILDTCNACGRCVEECPIDAIEEGEPIFIITDLCCEFAECVAVCPENAIVHENDIPQNPDLSSNPTQPD